MSLEAWGDEGNVPSGPQDTQLWHDLAKLQVRLFAFHESHKSDFPNDEFSDAYERADLAIQDMFGQLEE